MQLQLIQAQSINGGASGSNIGSPDPILLETIDKLQAENAQLKDFLQESVDQNMVLAERAIMVSLSIYKHKVTIYKIFDLGKMLSLYFLFYKADRKSILVGLL